MAHAHVESELTGIVPGEGDPRFIAQHLSAYAFARRYATAGRILEIGFGDGYGSNYLAEVASDVVGIDVTPGNIPRARAKYPRPNLRFERMDATRLEFPDASFDLVCSFQVIEHIPEPKLLAYLAEILRVLRPTGLCCISTLNLDHNRKPGRPYEKLSCHEKEFTAPELRALLAQVFPVVEVQGLHLTPTHRLMQRLKRWGLDRLGAPHANPVARFYAQASVADFTVRCDVSRAAIDLIALCRKTPADSLPHRLTP